MFGGVYDNVKVLITGNTGFKGAWLSLWLDKLGAEVIGLSDGVPTEPSLYEIAEVSDITKQYWVDVRNAAALQKVIEDEKPEIIFHLAAQSVVKRSFDDPLDTLTTNVIGTANVLNAVKVINRKCIVLVVTSDKCYDNKEWERGYKETDELGGKDIYSASKACAEHVVYAYVASFFSNTDTDIRVASARAGNVIGGGDWSDHRIIPDLIRALEVGNTLEIRHPEATRPWQFVMQPLSGYLQLVQQLMGNKNLHGEAFNFGPDLDKDVTVWELLKTLNKHLTNKPIEQVAEYKGNHDSREAGLLKLNCEKAERMLTWDPVLSFEESVAYTADWYKKYLAGANGLNELTLQQINAYCQMAEKKGAIWTK